MTEVTFLGGTRQIGASAILVEQGNARVVMDYGTAFSGSQRVPLPTSTHNLTSILSHAHLDHSGSLPLLSGSQTPRVPVYSTALTKDLARILLMDMLRIGGDSLAFEQNEVQNLLKSTQTVTYGESIQVHPKMRFTLYDAGHIPGSASILIETEQNGGAAARVFYTGDLNTTDTQLVRGAQSLRELGELDLVIVESTYARENHPSRQKVEADFIEATRTTLEQGGTVLVPSFAVGRAQEILSVLAKYRSRGLDYPIFLDGMARKVTRVMQQHTRTFTGGPRLQKAIKLATFIRNETDRKIAVTEPAIIIAPAGMLKGGAAQGYLQIIADDTRSSVLLVGKQLPGTPGAELIEQGTISLNSVDSPKMVHRVKARVEGFNFSCHVGQNEVLNYLKEAKGNPTILTMHGEPASCESLAQTLKTGFGFDATAATMGQTIAFN